MEYLKKNYQNQSNIRIILLKKHNLQEWMEIRNKFEKSSICNDYLNKMASSVND